MIHRNTYVNAPAVLQATFETRRRQGLFFAGQMSGVEGYVESAASGLIAGLQMALRIAGAETVPLPRETALGGLGHYISNSDPRALPAHQHRLRAAATPGQEGPWPAKTASGAG